MLNHFVHFVPPVPHLSLADTWVGGVFRGRYDTYCTLRGGKRVVKDWGMVRWTWMMLCCGHGSVFASSVTSSQGDFSSSCYHFILFFLWGWRWNMSPACSLSALPSEVRGTPICACIWSVCTWHCSKSVSQWHVCEKLNSGLTSGWTDEMDPSPVHTPSVLLT